MATTPKFWGAASGLQEFLLQLTVEKMRVFEVFTKKYLQWYGLMATILLTLLTAQIQKLKYKEKSNLAHNNIRISPLLAKLLFTRS